MKRAFLLLAKTAAVSAAVLTLAGWLLVREDIARLRKLEQRAKPVPPLVAKAIIAAEGPVLDDPPPIFPRAIVRSLRPNTVLCAPTFAFVVLRATDPSPRRSHLRTTIPRT